MVTYQERETYIWNKLRQAGFRDIEVAGIMGNLYEESGLRPENLQQIYEKILGMTDKEYTDAINSGRYSYKQFYSDHAGYGLAQWTYYTRKQAMYLHCFPEIDSLEKQVEYLIKEISWYPHVIKMLHAATTIRQCSDIILHHYEQPGNQSEAVEIRRAGYAQKIYDNQTKQPQPVDGWWTCQCAAYKTQKGAEAAAAKIKDAHVYRSHTPGYFAVAIGQYATQAEANAHLTEAKKQRRDAFVNYYKKEELI